MNRFKIVFAILFLALLPFSPGSANEIEDDTTTWTESIRSKDGIFAVSIDSANKRILLLRADDRALGALQLKVRLLRTSGVPLEVMLREVESAQAPGRYGARIIGEDFAVTGFDLESRGDGHTWKLLGKFRRGAGQR